MLYSMTGYGEARFENENIRIGFRLKSVNNRGLDANIKLPFDFVYLEANLRKILKQKLHRGRVDIFSEIEIRNPDLMPPVQLNIARLTQLMSLSDQIKQQATIDGDLDLNTLIRLPDLSLSQRVGFRLPEALDTHILEVFEAALDKLNASRMREGAGLRPFFLNTFQRLSETVEALDALTKTRADVLRESILRKLQQLASDIDLDPQRLAQEVVYYADRMDVTEEITRLRTHIQASLALINSGKRPLGKELEFLVQEQFREVTTIGNKAKHQEIAELVVSLKTDYEQIREQVLNLE